MAIDRADWHYGGDYPKELPNENGGTHIGMFLAWIILNNLEGDLHREDSVESLAAVRARTMTGRDFLFSMCDERFWNDDLNDEGLAFALSYYSGPEGKGYGQYIDDYERTLGKELPSIYHIENSWENFDKLEPIITKAYTNWKKSTK